VSVFITFEGVEGCGKSTQSRLLFRRLQRLAIPAILIHEPGVTSLGKKITHLLKWARQIEISPMAELLLFNASRAQLVEEKVRPSLQNGTIVICDRYADSTTAYQGYGRGLNLDMVKSVNKAGMQGTMPDLTILMDISPLKGLARKSGDKRDRFEKETIKFHNKVREGYLKLAAAEPGRWLIVDAEQSKGKIFDIIWQKVISLLEEKR
jgi:dTMP kinase